jgi:hypothetical protein
MPPGTYTPTTFGDMPPASSPTSPATIPALDHPKHLTINSLNLYRHLPPPSLETPTRVHQEDKQPRKRPQPDHVGNKNTCKIRA